jgi:DedD protein
MEQRLKQRLVGATVLVGLVVIVVPELFDDQEPAQPAISQMEHGADEASHAHGVPADEAVANVIRTESAPTLDEPELLLPTTSVPDTSSGAEHVEFDRTGSVSPDATYSIPMPRQKPVKRDTPVNAGLTTWVVQLASFSDSARASSLRDELVGQGYAAFVQTVANDSGTFSRVFVGPELGEEQAERLRERLLDQTKLRGQVVRYPG